MIRISLYIDVYHLDLPGRVSRVVMKRSVLENESHVPTHCEVLRQNRDYLFFQYAISPSRNAERMDLRPGSLVRDTEFVRNYSSVTKALQDIAFGSVSVFDWHDLAFTHGCDRLPELSLSCLNILLT